MPPYLSGKGNIKISNPTLVEGYRWWRTTGKISTQHSTCISVATVQTRNYTELNVNISQQCLFCSMPHLIWKKCIGLRKFGENRKQPKERSDTKSQGKILKHLIWIYNKHRFIQKICGRVLGRGLHHSYGMRSAEMHTHPRHLEVFIWTHAINPKLSSRQGWAWTWLRRPAPMIICGLVHVRQPTKRPQTATGWLHHWPRQLQISQGPLFRGKYFYNIKLFSWIYIQAC